MAALIFDAWNHLVQVKNGQTVLETYSDDALGRRITENPGTQRDLFWDSAWQLVEEDIGGAMADQYVWSPVYIDAMIERDTPTQRMYVQQDANFNVTALVDTSGNVQERYIYDSYGSMTILAANWTTRGSSNYSWVYGHQGGRLDNATGLYAFRRRDYSPALGRWMENDPIGFRGGDTNIYGYEGENPTNGMDASGLCDNGKPGQRPPYSSQGCHGGPSGPRPKPGPKPGCDNGLAPGQTRPPPSKPGPWPLPPGFFGPPPNPDGGIWPGLTPEQEQQQAWQQYMDEFDQNWGLYMLGPGGWWWDMWMLGMGGGGVGFKPFEQMKPIGPRPYPEGPQGVPKPTPKPPAIPQDPATSPGPGWEWRGKPPVGGPYGGWFKPDTGETLHPNLDHPPPIKPHWDYRDPCKRFWRVYPDGTIEPRK